MRVWSVCAAATAGVLVIGAGAAQAAEARLTAALGNTVLTLTDVAPKVTRVAVDDVTVFEDRDSETLSFVNAYPLKDHWVALFRADSGAKDCPSRFRIVETGGPKPLVSYPFGSCSDEAQVAITDAVMTVSMPVPSGGEAAWTYRDGRIARAR